MGVIARVVGVAACGLSLAVLAAAPTAGADPTGALPPDDIQRQRTGHRRR